MFTTSPSSQGRPWSLPPSSWVTQCLTPALLAVALVIGGCASAPPSAVRPDHDGAEANPPKDLDRVPDAEPRVETLRSGGPNKPYEVLGRRYVPFTQDRPFTERGLASWYGRKFHGRRTANGEVYDMYAMTAAHPTMPLPSYARVRNPANGREVVVRVNDRGPFHPGRIIDLSYTAALKLDLLRGVAPVEVERLTTDAIRAGSWRRGESVTATAAGAADGAATTVAAVAMGTAGAATTATTALAPEAAPTPADTGTPRIEAPAPAALPESAQASGFWIQLGAFRQRDGAEDFQRRVAAELDWPVERLAVFADATLYRLQAGPYASRDEARSVADRIRSSLQLVPVVLERR
jgi:rare lipoprotein A